MSPLGLRRQAARYHLLKRAANPSQPVAARRYHHRPGQSLPVRLTGETLLWGWIPLVW